MSVYKLILIGSSAVGKTSLCNSINGEMSKNIPITIGVDFNTAKLNVDNEPCTLKIWDTAGHEKFRSMTKRFYNNSNVILLCFDVTNRESFTDLEYWITEINNTVRNVVYICLFGLKSDLEPIIHKKEIEDFMITHTIESYYTFSTKKAKNIREILETVLHKYKLYIQEVNENTEQKQTHENAMVNLNEHASLNARRCCQR